MSKRPAAGAPRTRVLAFAFAGAIALGLAPQLVHALQVPALTAHVNDYARLLPADRASALDARLAAHERSTGQQFALLTIPSLEGEAIESFSIEVAEKWKLGSKGKDDGLIMIIAPNDHKMRIEVGYGLEGMIPDAVASRVLRDVLTPAFRQNDFAGGVDSAFAVLIDRAGGKSSDVVAPQQQKRTRHKVNLLPFLLPLIFFFLFSRGGRRGMWVAPMIMGSMGRGGGFRSGGFGGGGGGGGFGGGRGGGFGGGGASGGW